mgnify:CR=1 FL=1
MFLKETFRKFFIRDRGHDLYWFLFGLVFLFTFALIKMPQWIFCLSIGVLTSAIFRYITTDDLFYEEFLNLNTRSKKLKYILSKNMFTLFFLAFILLLYFISNIGIKIGIIGGNHFEFHIVFSIIIYILATENIILIFNHKLEPSYKSGYKRNYSEDLEVGAKNFKSMIPSLVINVILAILLFKFNINLNIFAGMCYLLASTAFFSIKNRLIF